MNDSHAVLDWYQLGFSVLVFFAALQREAIRRGRFGMPLANQRFARAALFILASAMFSLSLWGIRLDYLK